MTGCTLDAACWRQLVFNSALADDDKRNSETPRGGLFPVLSHHSQPRCLSRNSSPSMPPLYLRILQTCPHWDLETDDTISRSPLALMQTLHYNPDYLKERKTNREIASGSELFPKLAMNRFWDIKFDVLNSELWDALPYQWINFLLENNPNLLVEKTSNCRICSSTTYLDFKWTLFR